jgi:hypothetical protein
VYDVAAPPVVPTMLFHTPFAASSRWTATSPHGADADRLFVHVVDCDVSDTRFECTLDGATGAAHGRNGIADTTDSVGDTPLYVFETVAANVRLPGDDPYSVDPYV